MEVPFSKYNSGREVHSNVSDVLDAENVDQVEMLEGEFCEYVGVKYAVATSHGTSALHLAMLALELKRGDRVVCSVNAHPAIPEVVRHFDAEPIFIDIDEKDYNINLEKLESFLQENRSKKLKAVIVTHIAGKTVDLDKLYAIAKANDVKVVEDASDALGAEYKGKKVGATGADLVCFDFSPHLRKNVCNGGMLVSNDAALIERAKLLSNHAIVQSSDTLEYIYDVVDIGNDYSLSELNAAYIRAQLKQNEQNITRQREIAKLYTELLSDVKHITVVADIEEEHIYSLFIVKVDKNRDSFASDLKTAGVETGLHYIPLHLLSYYKTKYSLRVNDFPVALRTYQQILSLPIYPTMSDEEVEFVCDTIIKIASTKV